MKRAVLYLRVSTVGQVKTDYDPEGLSIPSQRKACQAKAQQLGLEVIDEYVEPGRSATNIEKRPVFQQMLERFRTRRDVDTVIVYNLSRLNRNRIDDVKVMIALEAYGVTLVSAQENIDDTPAGQFMHGILAAVNEYRSRSDGADVRYKMGQKAKNGGTVGKAKLGYLNVGENFEGRSVRSIGLDPDRAPLVQMAFGLYATGDYTLKTLAEELKTRGLRTRGFGRHPAGPVSQSQLGVMLRDPYYIGIVTYQGEQYPGRHQPLVTRELFAEVQRVLDAHSTAAERDRRHHHYLKGSLWCGSCHDRGIESRLILQRSVGRRGNVYWYFFCSARQDGRCRSPHQPVAAVEDAVIEHYRSIFLPEEVTERLIDLLAVTLDDELKLERLLREERAAKLRKLELAEENLLDLAATGEASHPKIRQRLADISRSREELEKTAAGDTKRLAAGTATLTEAIGLISNVQTFYQHSSDAGRRMINQAFFDRLYADQGRVTADKHAQPFDALLSLRDGLHGYNRRRATPANGSLVGTAWRSWSSTALLTVALMDRRSSKAVMARPKGFEPLTF